MVQGQWQRSRAEAKGQEQLFVRGTSPPPWGRNFSAFEFTKSEVRRSFQKQRLICGRSRESWPWPGSSCSLWRQAATSKESQAVLDCSSLLTLQLTFQIKSPHVGTSQHTESKEPWLPLESVLAASRGSGGISLAACVLPSKPWRLHI